MAPIVGISIDGIPRVLRSNRNKTSSTRSSNANDRFNNTRVARSRRQPSDDRTREDHRSAEQHPKDPIAQVMEDEECNESSRAELHLSSRAMAPIVGISINGIQPVLRSSRNKTSSSRSSNDRFIVKRGARGKQPSKRSDVRSREDQRSAEQHPKDPIAQVMEDEARSEPTTIPTVLPRWMCRRKLPQTNSNGKASKRRKRGINGPSVPSDSGQREVVNSGGVEVACSQDRELDGRGGDCESDDRDNSGDESASISTEIRDAVAVDEPAGVPDPGDDRMTVAVDEEEKLGGAKNDGISREVDEGGGLASEGQLSTKDDDSDISSSSRTSDDNEKASDATISSSESNNRISEEEKINEEPTCVDSLSGAANKSNVGEVTSPDPAIARSVSESAGSGTETDQSPENRGPVSEVHDSRMMDEGSDSPSSNSSPSSSDETSSRIDSRSSSSSSDEDDRSEPEDEAPTKPNPVEAECGSASDRVGERKLCPSGKKIGRTSNSSSRNDHDSSKKPMDVTSDDGPVDLIRVPRRLRAATILFLLADSTMEEGSDTFSSNGSLRSSDEEKETSDETTSSGASNSSGSDVDSYTDKSEVSASTELAVAEWVPSHDDILRAVDEICHGVDTALVSIGDVKQSIANRFGWEKFPESVRILIRRRLIDLINNARDPDHEAGPEKKTEKSKSMNDKSKKEEQVAAAPCDADEVRRQYALFRGSPALFPSQERLRFVRLPEEWIPSALEMDASGLMGEVDGEGDRESEDMEWDQQQHPPPSSLRYWPALVYKNIAELVRDLPSSESSMIKAKLFVEHRKQSSTVVARLLGWGCDTMAGRYLGEVSSPANFFPEPRLDVLRLSSPSITVCESNGELVPFYERQVDMEEAYMDELKRENDATSPAAGGRFEGDKEENRGAAERVVLNHATKFLSALDVALNMLALDLGSDPLPPHPVLLEGGKETPKAAGASAVTAGVTLSGGWEGGNLRKHHNSHPGGLPGAEEHISCEGDKESESEASDGISLDY